MATATGYGRNADNRLRLVICEELFDQGFDKLGLVAGPNLLAPELSGRAGIAGLAEHSHLMDQVPRSVSLGHVLGQAPSDDPHLGSNDTLSVLSPGSGTVEVEMSASPFKLVDE